MRIALIDCENLTGRKRLAAAFLWRGFDRVELYGREALVTPWRNALARLGIAVASETIIANDAPSQAADEAMRARVHVIAAQAIRPALVAIASNDRGFAIDIQTLSAAGITALQRQDPDDAELLRLLVTAQAGDGWANAGPIGERLTHDFGISLRGRIAQLAAKAGLELDRDATGGVRLRSPSLTPIPVRAPA